MFNMNIIRVLFGGRGQEVANKTSEPDLSAIRKGAGAAVIPRIVDPAEIMMPEVVRAPDSESRIYQPRELLQLIDWSSYKTQVVNNEEVIIVRMQTLVEAGLIELDKSGAILVRGGGFLSVGEPGSLFFVKGNDDFVTIWRSHGPDYCSHWLDLGIAEKRVPRLPEIDYGKLG